MMTEILGAGSTDMEVRLRLRLRSKCSKFEFRGSKLVVEKALREREENLTAKNAEIAESIY